jgi:hypothetical protein
MELEYSSVLLKELVENWEEDSGLYAPDMLCDHLEELFGKGEYQVTSAQVDGNHLELQIKSTKWKGIFECTLDSVGKLWYDRRPPKGGE